MSWPDRPAPPIAPLHRWTIHFSDGHYTVDAPTAEDALTMYRVNAMANERLATRIHKSENAATTARCLDADCAINRCKRLWVIKALSVASLHGTPLRNGFWIDGEEYQGVGTGAA